jgi:hypothetical protein
VWTRTKFAIANRVTKAANAGDGQTWARQGVALPLPGGSRPKPTKKVLPGERIAPGPRHGDPSGYLVRAVSDLGSQDYVCVSGAVGMALSELERVWRAWQALNFHDKARS